MNKDKQIYLSSPDMSGEEMKYIKRAFKQNWVAFHPVPICPKKTNPGFLHL